MKATKNKGKKCTFLKPDANQTKALYDSYLDTAKDMRNTRLND